MKAIFSTAILCTAFLSCNADLSSPNPIILPEPVVQVAAPPIPPLNKKVQVAILFDTSNSMDGLIDQAKARIWGIVNEVNSLRYEGQAPKIEIALYEYGKSSLESHDNWIRRILPFTNDLDNVSKELFALTTNGGDEYCGAVIKKSLDQLEWSTDPQDLKMIYIAGNEPFTQGPIKYQEVCSSAQSKGIFINTIYCGDYDQGIRESWKDGATCSQGDYFNINSDRKVVHIPTPYDDQIKVYNDELNKTYFGYGSMGKAKMASQATEDANAASYSQANLSERAITKSSANYSNASWDIVDGVEQGTVDLKNLKDDQLPSEMKGMNEKEKEAFIEEMTTKRKELQVKIQELAVKRQKYMDEVKVKEPEKFEDDFGTSVNESIEKKALKQGYIKN